MADSVLYKESEKEWFEGYIEYTHICQFSKEDKLKNAVRITVIEILKNYRMSFYELYKEIKNNDRFDNDLWYKVKNKAAFHVVNTKYRKVPKVIRWMIAYLELI